MGGHGRLRKRHRLNRFTTTGRTPFLESVKEDVVRRRLTNLARRWATLAVLATLGLSGRPAFGQAVLQAPLCPCPYPGSQGTMPGTTTPPGTPSTETPSTPETGTTPPSGLAAFGAEAGGAVGGETTAFAAPALSDTGGYLDYVLPRNRFRLRYDSAFEVNRPDRATYIYGAWKELSFHPHAIRGSGRPFFDGGARGPDQLPTEVNYQEPSAYFEAATKNHRFSGFLDIPLRFVDFRHLQEDPEKAPFFHEPPGEKGPQHTNLGGLSDIQVGFKAALLADPKQFLTFQLRTYIPTGNAANGLGTGHVSLEPSLLLFKQMNDRLIVQGQLSYWIPITSDPVAGNIFMYGAGLGYDVYRNGNLHVVPITELLGWTVLDGFQSVFGPMGAGPGLPQTHGVASAAGDTIVNIKFGARTYFGGGHDVYVGWGHALTGDRWYRNILRVEYRYQF